MAFMGRLSLSKLAAYNSLRNQQTALKQHIVDMPMVELANKIAEKVNDIRTQAAAVHPPPAEVSAEGALAAVPLACTFCNRPNHMEAHCRVRLATIKTIVQAKAESENDNQIASKQSCRSKHVTNDLSRLQMIRSLEPRERVS